MSVLPEAPRTPVDRLRAFVRSMDYAANSSVVASLLVAATAILLAVVHLELQYVVGGIVIVYAQRLAMKRLSPTVLHVPEPPKVEPRRVREMLDPSTQKGPSD